jgi:uncharacterized protein (DUF736 family)
MIIGAFTPNTDPDTGKVCGYSGEIHSLIFTHPRVEVIPAYDPKDERPDFRVYSFPEKGEACQIGEAWDGENCVVMVFDGPGVLAPIHARLVQIEPDYPDLRLHWERVVG